MLREYQFIPLDKIGDLLIILGATLLDRDVLREIQRLSGCQIYQYIGTWSDIRQAIDRLYKKKEGEGEDLTSLGKLLLSDGENGEAPAPTSPLATPPQPSAPKDAPAAAPGKPRKGLLNLFRKK
jgi:hypothetical protein